jgi:FixJ family two-component response regulator
MKPTPKSTLFVIEDDEAVRTSLQALLEIVGYTVASFAAGEEFLECADMHRGICAVLDVKLPGASGLEILKRLRDQGNAMPVVLVSGRTDQRMRACAERLGARALLEKPYEIDDLLALINAVDGSVTATSDAR